MDVIKLVNNIYYIQYSKKNEFNKKIILIMYSFHYLCNFYYFCNLVLLLNTF